MKPKISILPVLKHSYVDFCGENASEVILSTNSGEKLEVIRVSKMKNVLINMSNYASGCYYIIVKIGSRIIFSQMVKI